jgi:hypothetical protein
MDETLQAYRPAGRPGEGRLRQSIRRLRQAALGKTAAEYQQESLPHAGRPEDSPYPPHSLEAILARLEALEREIARIRESDARLLRAVLMAAALLLVELLTK